MAADNLLRVIGDLVKRDGLRTKAEQEKNTDKMAEKKQKSFDDALNKILKNQSKNDGDEEEPEDEPEPESEPEKEPEPAPEEEPKDDEEEDPVGDGKADAKAAEKEPEPEDEPEPEKEPEDDEEKPEDDEDEKGDDFDNKPSGPDPALVAQVAAIVKQEIKDEDEGGDKESEIKLSGKREKINTKPKMEQQVQPQRIGKMSFREAIRMSVTGTTLEEGFESHVLEILEDEGIKGPLGYSPFFEKGKLFVEKGSEKVAQKVLKKSGEINKIPKIVGEELEPEEYLKMESVEVDGRKTGFKEALKRLTYKKFKQMKEKAKKDMKELWRKSLLGEEHTSYWMPEGLSKEGAAEFMAAASAAKKDGKKKFKFGDKEYPVTIKVDIPLKGEQKEDVDQDSALQQIGLLDVVEKAMSSKDITKAAIKKFGKDPLYLAVFTAKSRSEAEKAHKTLMSIRGKDAVMRIADWLKKIKEETVLEKKKVEKEDAGSFMAAASAAKRDGKKTFKFGDPEKEYPVTIKVDIPLKKEEVEVDEKKGSAYDLYHKTFSGAMQHAYDHAKKKGFVVDTTEIDDKVATGPKKPSSGKTNRYILGTDKKKKVHIQVANLDNKRYELNMYIEEVEFDESNELQAIMALGDEKIEAEINKKGQVVVKKKDLKKAEKALKKSFKKGGIPELVGEEVELTEALGKLDKSVIDAFYYKKEKAGKVVSSDGDTLMKNGMGGQTIAQWLNPSGKIAISAVTDVKSTESILKYMKKSIPKGNFDKKSYKKFFGEETAIEKIGGIRKRLIEGLDRHAVAELKLYIENDSDLYRQQIVPIIKNVQRRMKSGKYDHTKAPKLWMYLVDNGAKKYVKEFGGDVRSQFPKDVRQSIAIEFANEYRAEIESQGGDML